MRAADDSKRGKSREENHVSGQSIHQHVRKSKQAESDESRMTRDLQQQRSEGLREAKRRGADLEVKLGSKGVSFGSIIARPDGTFDATRIEGIDPDLVLKPFGAKGVVISLREFTTNALNQHSGMQTLERFGWERTGSSDFDEDGVKTELTEGQLSALTLFQASLPAPNRIVPKTTRDAAKLRHGAKLFHSVTVGLEHVLLTVEELKFVTRSNFAFFGYGEIEPAESAVKEALNHVVAPELGRGAIRVSLGYATSDEDVGTILKAWGKLSESLYKAGNQREIAA
jgi:hypothetical protein